MDINIIGKILIPDTFDGTPLFIFFLIFVKYFMTYFVDNADYFPNEHTIVTLVSNCQCVIQVLITHTYNVNNMAMITS